MKKNKKTTSVDKALGMIRAERKVSKNKFRPLNIVDLDSDSDVEKLLKGLKRPKGKSYMSSLIGKGVGPRDLSENKYKYI